jgi:hypothetical protein
VACGFDIVERLEITVDERFLLYEQELYSEVASSSGKKNFQPQRARTGADGGSASD